MIIMQITFIFSISQKHWKNWLRNLIKAIDTGYGERSEGTACIIMDLAEMTVVKHCRAYGQIGRLLIYPLKEL